MGIEESLSGQQAELSPPRMMREVSIEELVPGSRQSSSKCKGPEMAQRKVCSENR